MDDQLEACHWLLLNLAGLVPDDTLTVCRAWLADDDLEPMTRAIGHAVAAGGVPIDAAQFELLADLYELAGAHAGELTVLGVNRAARLLLVDFAPTRAAADRALAEILADPGPRPPIPPIVDQPVDEVERALVAAAASDAAVLAVWRAWRFPSAGAPWPPPHRVVVVEAVAGAHLPRLTGRLQRVLAEAGEKDPQVEVYPTAAELPTYQFQARGSGALLWARTPGREVRIAELFDSVDPLGGGVFSPGHPTIDDPERGRILRYLHDAEVLVVAATAAADTVDPGRGDVVPMNLRTDGHWIWSDAAAYYLEHHGLSPDPELVAHIRAEGYSVPEIDGAALHRADVALHRHMEGVRRQAAERERPVLHARTPLECELYMRLHPCDCGEAGFPWSSHGQREHPDGGLESTYDGRCPNCGIPRRFRFAVDEDPVPPPAIGGPGPSRIIDPGQFLRLAREAAAAATLPPRPTPEVLERAEEAAVTAVAAIEEVLKFLPPEADAVPAEAFASDEGRALYAADPARFGRGRLNALRDLYLDRLPSRRDRPVPGAGVRPAPLPPARTALEAGVYAFLTPCEVCGEHGLDTERSTVTEDGQVLLRLAGDCPRCGTRREFRFPRPDEVVVAESAEQPVFGGSARSQLLDPGQWIAYAEYLADGTPDEPTGMSAEDRADARFDLLMAAAALEEALKFLPPSADAVPKSAIWTETGLEVFAEAPTRFGRTWLSLMAQNYRAWAQRFAS